MSKIIQFPGANKESNIGFVFKVTLRHIKPPIWRRILVPDGITLNQFHNIIQEAMGWYDCHLHSFHIGSKEYGIPDPDFADDMIDDTTVSINSIVKKVKQKGLYTYDFGDNWEHDILFESRVDNPDQEARVLDGKRACPPEDCGGIWGYGELLELLNKKKRTEEEQERIDWLGEDYEPENLDIDDINESLKDGDWREIH